MKRVLLLACLLLFCSLPPPARARFAIGISEGTSEVVSTSNTTIYDFQSFTPTVNATHVIFACARGTVDDGNITNVSGTALTWTRKGSVAYNGGIDTCYVWWARTGGSTAASVYRVDFTGDAATGTINYFFTFTGADQTTADPIRQITTNLGTSTNATGTFGTNLLTGSGYAAAWVGALSSSNPANVSTAPTSWTEIGDVGVGSPTSNCSAAYRAGGETGNTVTFTNASTTWGFIAVEVYESGAGPAASTRRAIVF